MARRKRFEQLSPEETNYAHLAPTFDRFPGFVDKDFDAFRPEKQRDARLNGERLVVKRKLAALGQEIEERVAPADLGLAMRTSLSHPYRHNAFKVASMWVYWGRGDKAKAALKRVLGADLGQDLDPTYQGVILVVEIDERRIACGLKIHPNAWWDGQNLKRRLQKSDAEAARFAELVNALPAGYAMQQSGFQRKYLAGKLRGSDMSNFFHYYAPGERWLDLLMEMPRAEAIAPGEGLRDVIAERLAALEPVYRFALWSEANNAILSTPS
jgi:hypothetical protein